MKNWWSKVNKPRLRKSVYAVTSAGLKVAGIYGLVTNDESQAYLLLISAVLDLAFFNVPSTEPSTGPIITDDVAYRDGSGGYLGSNE